MWLKKFYNCSTICVSFFIVKLKILPEEEQSWNGQVPNILLKAFAKIKTKWDILASRSFEIQVEVVSKGRIVHENVWSRMLAVV